MMIDPTLADWARRLQSMAQTGLAFARDPYDIERYHELNRIAAEMLAGGDPARAETLTDLFEREQGYATPKVDVRGFALRDGTVLLVRARADGGWTLPGGWADVALTPAENVVREMREEAGFEARAVRLLAVWDREKHPHRVQYPFHIYKIFFLCELTGGAPQPSDETSEVDFFSPDALPELSLGRATPWQLERLFALASDPTLPVAFD
jgi:ADP-ribose pyrophosphatase YjhB (NUDIX family)